MVESPWLTASASRTDFDSTSGTALHSIYGSQVSQLPFSSSQVSIEDYSEEDDWFPANTTTVISRRSSSPLRSRRPTSAPPKSLTQLYHRPSSAAPVPSSSFSKLKRHSNRPTTALPTATSRNTTVSQHYGGASTRRRVSRPSTAQPLRGGRNTVARPSSARPLSYTTTVLAGPGLVQYTAPNDHETESRIKEKTVPVSLTNVPRYFNFWNEKPIRQREWGVTMHERKPRNRRPKSDYGIRGGLNRNRLNDGKGEGRGGDDTELGTLFEVVDAADSGQSSDQEGGRGKRRRGRRGGKNGKGNDEYDSDERSSQTTTDKEDTVHQFDDFNDLNGIDDHTMGSESDLLNNKGQYSSSLSAGDDDQDTQKFLQLERSNEEDNDADNDDYFSSKTKDDKQKKSKSLSSLDSFAAGVMAAMATRFELPMDLKTLEVMRPSEYLSRYCIISQRRKLHYLQTFTKLKQKEINVITEREKLLQGIIEVHFKLVTKEEVTSILQVAEISEQQPVDIQLFGALCALTERRYCSMRPGFGKKELIERVDFEALDWRLRNCVLSDSLQQIFQLL